MLKQRVLTASLLGAVFVIANFSLPSPYFALLLTVPVVLAALEWVRLAAFTPLLSAAFTTAVLILGAGLISTPVLLIPVATVAVAWWTGSTILLWRYRGHGSTGLSRAGRVVGGLFVLVVPWCTLYGLHRGTAGPTMVMLLLAMVWIADSAAYMVGRVWGKRPLAPLISPGKSIEGLLGGLVGVIVFTACSGVWILNLSGNGLVAWVCLGVLTALYSVAGDLIESRVKRQAGVKDSGNLLPGHGGILDRIDSVTAAAPVFFIAWNSAQALGITITA